ncbi:hypothetical protein N7536_008633 [Penicillium majusculum]|nr:hypothetical protein N7536_008633 [Penicillium majusculum]
MCCVEMEDWVFACDIDVDVDVDDDGGGGIMTYVAFLPRSAGRCHLSSRKVLFDAIKEAKMQKRH